MRLRHKVNAIALAPGNDASGCRPRISALCTSRWLKRTSPSGAAPNSWRAHSPCARPSPVPAPPAAPAGRSRPVARASPGPAHTARPSSPARGCPRPQNGPARRSRRLAASSRPPAKCLGAGLSRQRFPLTPRNAIPEGAEPPDPPDAVTICRPRHPLEGTTVAVIGLRSAGHRGLRVKVRLPDGSSCWLPESWTSLGVPAAGAPRLAGELPDFLALRTLVWTLAERRGAADGGRSHTAPAGAAGVGGTLAALAGGAASGAGTAGPGTVEGDDPDGAGGDGR